MLDYKIALTQLLNQVQSHQTPIEQRHLNECVGLYLAQNIQAHHDIPLFDNSAMDGYAICLHTQPNSTDYQIVGRIAAGDTGHQIQLKPGQAARIFTGAPTPVGANAVIPQENTIVDDDLLMCQKPAQIGEHIRLRAEDVHVGQNILEQGRKLTPAALGLAASQGYSTLPIHRRLRVTVFSTGNELLEPDQALTPAAIYDANRYLLIAWLQKLGCTVVDGGILRDDSQTTCQSLQNAAQNSDIILTSGGASVGEEDHLKAAVQQIGTLTQWKLAIKPGKPFAWGHIENCPVMILPGNPVASFVTFKMLVEPAIQVMQGAQMELAQPTFITARANFSKDRAETRREFLRGWLYFDANGVGHVDRLKNQGSHMLSACVQANCLVEIAPNLTVQSGDALPVYFLKD